MCLLLACMQARADSAISLFKSFAGNVNFAGTQVTMRTGANGSANSGACAVNNGTLSATLAGIPTGAIVLSAQLYWAGSGGTPDYTITFEGLPLTAPNTRRYTSSTIGGGFDYFSGAIDVTTQVQAKRNGSYTFSGLSINNGSPWCASEGVVGGFSLLVVYSLPSETFRVLNIYEGFQFIRNSSVPLSLSNFKIPTPLGTATGRIGTITWEGDASIAGEDLQFNGADLVDTINPLHNPFNSASSINGDKASYGVDFDAYTVGAPIIASGQTSASTYYASGNDLVMLSAEIIAVPNAPTADLSIALTRSGTFQQGANVAYNVTVTNNGPNVEPGPVTVTDTLPAGTVFASAGGTGWTCSAAGQVVTCTSGASVAINASLPVLTINAQVTASGTITNTVSVDGADFDNNSGNDSASNSGTASAASGNFVFTTAQCVSGKAFGAAGQTCAIYPTGPMVAGTPATVWVTALSVGVPTTPNASTDTTVRFNFALACVNPTSNAGIASTYSGVTLPLCSANGAAPTSWSPPSDLTFKAGSATASMDAPSFDYDDVGKVILSLRDGSNRTVSTAAFVVKPAQIKLIAVSRNADASAMPTVATGADSGFTRVGETFTMKAAALTSDGAVTPNFGSEGALLTLDVQLPADAATRTAMVKTPGLGAINFATVVGGVFTRTDFAADDVGIVAVTPNLVGNDYLGAGAVPTSALNVGRFYPDHFDTVVSGPMVCLAHMLCPGAVTAAAYSAQSFSVTVKAMGPDGSQLQNYSGVLSRAISLAAYSASGAGTVNPASGTLTGNTIAAAASLTGSPVYTLPNPFSYLTPRANNWTVPTAIWLRASASENLAASTATVSSARSPVANTREGAIEIVSGRLSLGNPYGSELLKMPVRMEAQYFTAARRWETSSGDSFSNVSPGGIVFANCLKNLGSPCKTTVLAPATSASVTVASGVGTFWLKAPGAGNTGSAEFRMSNPAWLPTTVGRAVFGIYKSPLIYVREIY
jgi:uncharacterized repeat protein (TIGR01451 family)